MLMFGMILTASILLACAQHYKIALLYLPGIIIFFCTPEQVKFMSAWENAILLQIVFVFIITVVTLVSVGIVSNILYAIIKVAKLKKMYQIANVIEKKCSP
jgi:hypothetical protein